MSTGPGPPDDPVSGGPPGRPGLFDLQAFLRKFIPFSQSPIKHGLKSGRGQYLTLTFGAAHTDTTFAHTLGHTPEQVIVVQAPRPTPATATVGGTLTFGTHLTGGSYNGTADVTLATDATNLNTASTIVARDASGNFTAGTITAALTGNADTATKLATARAINTVNFDGSAAITIKASTTNVLTFGTHLTSGGSSFDGSAAVTITSDATSANTASTIVARDAAGAFAMGALTATTGAHSGLLSANGGLALPINTITTPPSNGIAIGVDGNGNGVFRNNQAGGADLFTFQNSGGTGGAPVQAAAGSGGSTLAYLPPVYLAAGTSLANTTHIVADKVTASGVSTTVTLSSAAAFASATYALLILDETGLTYIAPTSQAAGSFAFASVNTRVYSFFAIGA